MSQLTLKEGKKPTYTIVVKDEITQIRVIIELSNSCTKIPFEILEEILLEPFVTATAFTQTSYDPMRLIIKEKQKSYQFFVSALVQIESVEPWIQNILAKAGFEPKKAEQK